MIKDNEIILKECILELVKAVLSHANIKLIETETYHNDEPELSKLKIDILYLEEPKNKKVTKTFTNIDENDCSKYRRTLINVLKLIDEYIDADVFIGDNIINYNEPMFCETRGSDIENNVIINNSDISPGAGLYNCDCDFKYKLSYQIEDEDNIHLTPSLLKMHLYLSPEYKNLDDDKTDEDSFIENEKTANLDLVFDFDDNIVSLVMKVIDYEVWDWDTQDITEHERKLLDIKQYLDRETPFGTCVKKKLLELHPDNAYINVLYVIPNLLNLFEKIAIMIKKS